MVLCCDPASHRIDGRSFSARDLTQHQRLCIKGRRWGAGEQGHKAMTVQILTRHGGPSSLCPDCNTSRDCTDGHFSAHGMPDGARVVSSSYGQRVERVPRDPQVPLPDALGGPGSRLSPVSIPQHGAGDSGAEHGFLRHSTKIARTPSKLTGEYTRSDEGATIAAGPDQARRSHQGREISSRLPVIPESAAARKRAGSRSPSLAAPIIRPAMVSRTASDCTSDCPMS